MSIKNIQLKLIYKLIITFLLVVIIPITISYVVLNNFITTRDNEQIENRLKYGRDFTVSMLKNNQTVTKSNTVQLINDGRLLSYLKEKIYNVNSNANENNDKILSELLADYQIGLISIYDEYAESVAQLQVSLFKRLSLEIDSKLIKSGLNGYYAREFLVSNGIVLLVSSKIKLGNFNYILLIGKFIPGGFLDQLRNSLNMEFTFVVDNKRVMTTLFDAYGTPLVNSDYKLPSEILNNIDIANEDGVIIDNETHLNKKYKSFYYPVKLEGSEDSIWIIVSQVSDFSSSELIKRFLLMSSLFSIILVIVALFFIARRIVSPIQMLSNRIKLLVSEIANQQELDLINVKSNDEIKILADNFNSMALNLQKAYSELMDINQNLEQKVERRTKQLAERTEELDKLNSQLKVKNDSMNRELLVASIVQKTLLPEPHIQKEKFEIFSKLLPMTQTSGDYIDVWEISDGIYGLLVIDVSGHGVPSALITTMAKVSFRNHSKPENNTAQVLSNINLDLQTSLSQTGFYFTAFMGIYDSNENTFEYTNAGHPPALLINKVTGQIQKLDTQGMLIGAFETVMYEFKKVKLTVNDRIFLYSDGITGARKPYSSEYDDGRFNQFMFKNYALEGNTFIEALLKDIDDFNEFYEPNDDKAILILDIK